MSKSTLQLIYMNLQREFFPRSNELKAHIQEFLTLENQICNELPRTNA